MVIIFFIFLEKKIKNKICGVGLIIKHKQILRFELLIKYLKFKINLRKTIKIKKTVYMI